MSSKIEQIIEEIEDYVSECKYQTFSSKNIIVDKDVLEEFLGELRMKIPSELRQCQSIISNRENILSDAQAKADEIIAQAQIQTNELISDHQIMLQAYARANEIVLSATNQAQETIDRATGEANAIRQSAMDYTDEQLRTIEAILTHAIDAQKSRNDALLTNLQNCLDVIVANRLELNPPQEEVRVAEAQAQVPPAAPSAPGAQKVTADTADLDIPI